MNIRAWFRPYPELKRGIINLKSGTALRGIIFNHAGPYLIIREAQVLADRGTKVPAGKPLPVDGEVLVHQRDVDFIQLVDLERQAA